jgi:hypothetical protein
MRKGDDVRAADVNAADKPIGYWLKHLHNLIEAQFEATLSDLHLGRRHWQVLNLLAGATYPRTQIEQALAPFWQNTALDLDAVLDGQDGLITLGWVDEAAGSAAAGSATDGGAADGSAADGGAAAENALALTEKGRTAYTTVSARVAETRGRLLRGLTLEQYVETVRVLSVMAENVESALADTALSATRVLRPGA